MLEGAAQCTACPLNPGDDDDQGDDDHGGPHGHGHDD
jgi:hypothetical protein